MLWGVLLTGPRLGLEIAFAPLGALWFIRWLAVRSFRRKALVPFTHPLAIATCALVAWQALSMLWTNDAWEGLEEFAPNRWLIAGVLLFPGVLYLRHAIVGLGVGFVMGVGVLVAGALGHRYDVPWLCVGTPSFGRHFGWWNHPTQAGHMLAAGFALFLPMALAGAGPEPARPGLGAVLDHFPRPLNGRAFGVVAAGACAVGVALTGTRAAIASAIVIVLIVAGVGLARLRRARSRAIAIVALLVLVGAFALSPSGRHAIARFEQAARGVRAALASGDYSSDDGVRVRHLAWAWSAFLDAPITGHGSGSYRGYVLERASNERASSEPGRALALVRDRTHLHPHNTPMHLLATLGVVGLALWIIVVALALRAVWVGRALGPTGDGIALALVALLVLIPAESLHHSSRTGATMNSVLALCLLGAAAARLNHPPTPSAVRASRRPAPCTPSPSARTS